MLTCFPSNKSILQKRVCQGQQVLQPNYHAKQIHKIKHRQERRSTTVVSALNFDHLREQSSAMVQPLDKIAGLALTGLGLAVGATAVIKVFNNPSRKYNNNVGQEYDAWTSEGVLEHYWGDNIHLGYYSEEDQSKGFKKKDFKYAKVEFIDRMLEFSKSESPKEILDVGCGFGGSSRHLAKKFPAASVQGITLSPKQVERGIELAAEQGLTNVTLQVMDALKMDFPDNSFDLVWACESGEHMPDKRQFVEEMLRVLRPGGRLVIACWCQRDAGPENPITKQEQRELNFLYDEWAHPFFVSKEAFGRIMQDTGSLGDIEIQDWTKYTLPSWRHSLLVGVWDPWIVIFKGPRIWYKTAREAITIERMHKAFEKGLMEYGMLTATKTTKATAE